MVFEGTTGLYERIILQFQFQMCQDGFPLSRNFSTYEMSRVNIKVEPRSTSRLSSTLLPLFYFRVGRVKFTCVYTHLKISRQWKSTLRKKEKYANSKQILRNILLKMTLFSLKQGQDLENRAAYPTKNCQAYPRGLSDAILSLTCAPRAGGTSNVPLNRKRLFP